VHKRLHGYFAHVGPRGGGVKIIRKTEIWRIWLGSKGGRDPATRGAAGGKKGGGGWGGGTGRGLARGRGCGRCQKYKIFLKKSARTHLFPHSYEVRLDINSHRPADLLLRVLERVAMTAGDFLRLVRAFAHG
jgi:hypothetical protein